MVDIKVCLTVVIPGSVLISKADSKKEVMKPVLNKNGKQVYRNGKPLTKKFLVDDWDKCDKNTLNIEVGRKQDTLTYYTRKCVPAKQTINICKEAYDYMTSKEVPSFSDKFSWFRMNKAERLKAHLMEICKSLNGKSFTFEVFED